MKILRIIEGAEPLRWALEEHAKMVRELGPLPEAPKPDGLITLREAAALPELGGAISIKSIRAAVSRGDIVGIQPGGPHSTVYVTRRAVLEWIEKCRVPPHHPASTSEPRATATERSARTRPGSSSRQAKRSALDAALKTVRELKQR